MARDYASGRKPARKKPARRPAASKRRNTAGKSSNETHPLKWYGAGVITGGGSTRLHTGTTVGQLTCYRDILVSFLGYPGERYPYAIGVAHATVAIQEYCHDEQHPDDDHPVAYA